MPEPRTCPYCNALLPAPGAACPRCGEASAPFRAKATATPERRRGFPWIFVAIVGLLGAVIYFTRDRKPPPPPPTSVETVVAPRSMPGLGYLPESCELILAIQVRPLTRMMETDDPAAALVKLGLPSTLVANLDKFSGVGLKEVDQIVLGASFDKGSLPPHFVVVVHTRSPFNLEAMAKEAKARTLKKDERTLHAVKAAGLLADIYWWAASDRVLVGTLLTSDYDRVPMQPLVGVDHLKASLTAPLYDRVPDSSAVWLVAASDRWKFYLTPYLTLPVPTPLQGRDDLAGPAERLRDVSFFISEDPARPVEMQVGQGTAQQAGELATRWKKRFAEEPISVEQTGATVKLSTAFDAARVGMMIERLFER